MIEKLPLRLDATPGHLGPVWLDRIDREMSAPWGFGAAVGQALDRRREALRARGIAPDEPGRDRKLAELERRAVGEGMAARTGQQFLAATPDRFRGRLLAIDGAPYAVVTDGERFVVVRASLEIRALDRKSVAISRDANGRPVIRGLGMDRGR